MSVALEMAGRVKIGILLLSGGCWAGGVAGGRGTGWVRVVVGDGSILLGGGGKIFLGASVGLEPVWIVSQKDSFVVGYLLCRL